MACFLHIIHSSNPKFYMTHYKGVLLVMHCDLDGMDQVLVPKSGGFHEFLIEELYITPLDSHLGIQKLTYALFQRVWWPNPGTVTSFVHSCMTCA